jgi:uncharacterized protein
MADAAYETPPLRSPESPILERATRESWLIDRALTIARRARREDVAIAYLVLIAIAEFLTAFVQPVVGVAGHAILLGILLVHASSARDSGERAFVLSLTLAPLIRIVSLGMPIGTMPEQWQFLLTGLPLLIAALLLVRVLALSRADIRLQLPALRWWPGVVATGAVGALIAGIEYDYSILRPPEIVSTLRLEDVIVPALAVALTTGFTEELIFRGILQTTAGRILGTRAGIIYVSALFAVLHMGIGSSLGLVIAFLVGIFFGVIAQWSKSLAGVVVAHIVINVLLFVVLPAL